MLDEKVNRAIQFAVRAHAGQVRKYTSEPYVIHCLRVANIAVNQSTDVRGVIPTCAAILHDTVEDTSVTVEDIREAFGGAVARIVDGLTDKSTKADGNRKARKAIDNMRLSKVDWVTQSVKVADIIDNCRDILLHDPDFARVYLREKAETLDYLTLADKKLRDAAITLIREGIASLASGARASAQALPQENPA
jgi:(p)ppGpp synthase/HD superfamily hydrolase